MNSRVKDALLWGVVGLGLFLVLIQGYEIVEGVGVDLTVTVVAALVVAVATTVVTYATRVWLSNDADDETQAVDDSHDREDAESDDQTA